MSGNGAFDADLAALQARVGSDNASALLVMAVAIAGLETDHVTRKAELVRAQLAEWVDLDDARLANVTALAQTNLRNATPDPRTN
jgi:hypothetical protein